MSGSYVNKINEETYNVYDLVQTSRSLQGIISKGVKLWDEAPTHKEVTMVISLLTSDSHFDFIVPRVSGHFQKIFRM